MEQQLHCRYKDDAVPDKNKDLHLTRSCKPIVHYQDFAAREVRRLVKSDARPGTAEQIYRVRAALP